MKAIRISKRVVDALEPGATDLDFFDDDLKGFGFRVRTSGRKSYFVMMRFHGVLKRFTIGPHGAITTELARIKAKVSTSIQTVPPIGVQKGPLIVIGKKRPESDARSPLA